MWAVVWAPVLVAMGVVTTTYGKMWAEMFISNVFRNWIALLTLLISFQESGLYLLIELAPDYVLLDQRYIQVWITYRWRMQVAQCVAGSKRGKASNSCVISLLRAHMFVIYVICSQTLHTCHSGTRCGTRVTVRVEKAHSRPTNPHHTPEAPQRLIAIKSVFSFVNR